MHAEPSSSCVVAGLKGPQNGGIENRGLGIAENAVFRELWDR